MSGPPPRLPVTVVSSATGVWGTERSILGLAPHLRDLGVDLTLACPPGEFAAAARAAGLPVAELVLPPRGGPLAGPPRTRLRALLRDARGVPSGVASVARVTRGAAVVHSNNLMTHPDAALAGRLTGRPTVLELHDIVSPQPGVAAQSLVVALSSAAVSISSAVTARVRPPGLRKVHLLTQAVDLDTFLPGRPEPAWRAVVPAPFVVGMVGRVDPSKGIDVLVRAAARAGDVGVVVAGKPSLDGGGYLAAVRELGGRLLGANFHYAGAVAMDAVPGLMRSLDVLVNASTDEPFGLSLLEAMACGVPAVGTTSGGASDFVRDGHTGFLTPAGDVAALSAALARLRDDRALGARFAADGLALARAEHGTRTRAERLAGLYRAVARPVAR